MLTKIERERVIDGVTHVWDVFENAWVTTTYWSYVNDRRPAPPPASPLTEPIDPTDSRVLTIDERVRLERVTAEYTWHGDTWSRDGIRFLLDLVRRLAQEEG